MRTFLAIAGLIVAAIAVAVIIAFLRPNSSSTPPSEVETKPPAPTETKPPANAGAKAPNQSKTTTSPPLPGPMLTFDQAKQGAVRVRLEIEGRGSIVMELYPKAAPKTVAHIISLCKQHFYNGILVHRVETNPSFRLFQAGDPASKALDPKQIRGKTTAQVAEDFQLGGGGSGATVPLEATLPNSADSVGLARSQDPDSGDSQFYVNLSDNNMLDGKYCVFGRVIKGKDVAEKVEIGDRILSFSSQ
jgi:cyclophilin family peptidyl-prolyl cis-trans isomerase